MGGWRKNEEGGGVEKRNGEVEKKNEVLKNIERVERRGWGGEGGEERVGRRGWFVGMENS